MSPENSISQKIEELKRKIGTPSPKSNVQTLRQSITAVIIAYATAATELRVALRYSDSEELHADWKQFIDEYDRYLEGHEALFHRGRYYKSEGLFWESRGLYEYLVKGNFLALHFFENAKARYERAREYMEKIELDSSAPAPIHEMLRSNLRQVKADLLRARGCQLYAQGEFELKVGAIGRAQELLPEAISTLRAASSVDGRGERGYSRNLADIAESTLWRAKSDEAILRGDLETAAKAELEGAKACERCLKARANVDNPFGDKVAGHLARDAYIARQRHDRFLALAATQPRLGWLKSMIFFVLAMAPLLLLMYWNSRSNFMEEKFVVVVFLFYTFAVAGIGAQLLEWREGADWLIRSVSDLKKDS